MNNKAEKDRWILHAIATGYLVPREDGTILRRASNGEYRQVVFRTHTKTGRVYFNLTYAGHTKSVLVNRVIALKFLPNPDNLPQVNHIDGVKAHNWKTNLEWSSAGDNEKHAHATGLKTGRGSANSNAKITAADVLAIRAATAAPADLAQLYGVSRSTIHSILKRKTWSHI